MTDYRCYFVDDQEHVRGVASHVVCPDDSSASRIAKELLADECQHVTLCRYAAVEVWDHARQVSRLTRVESWAPTESAKRGSR